MIHRLHSFVSRPFSRKVVSVVAVTMALLHCVRASAQSYHFALESTTGLRLVNVTAEAATLQGKKCLRAIASEKTRALFQRMTVEAQARQTNVDRSMIESTMIVIDEIEFTDGIIEVEIAGAPAPGASSVARGFVGIAFRLQNDLHKFEQFYLRPTNGRAEDQERRNHAVQYSSHPDWPFDRLRREAPSRYEAYVDLVPSAWTRVRIEVHGTRARLYVHGQKQPTLIVNDLKTGAQAKGRVALTLDVETVAHFRNLTITPANTGDGR